MEAGQKYGEVNPQIIESLVLHGDISKMSSTQKVEYYDWLCNTLGLNPATQPFQIIKFQGKEILYAKKDATEQLRKLYGVSVIDLDKLFHDDIYIVTAKMQDRNGRLDVATGAVSIKGLSGDNLANALMKAETKAKRRGTLSICGLGLLDESETDTIGHFEEVKLDKIEPKKVAAKTKTNNEVAAEMFTPENIGVAVKVEHHPSGDLIIEKEKPVTGKQKPIKPEPVDEIAEKIKQAKTIEELVEIHASLSPKVQAQYVNQLSTRKSIIKANTAA